LSKNENLGGGLPVCRLPPLAPLAGGTSGISLLSDLHLGSANTDEARVRADLERARASGDRVLIGGDVADLLLPSDRKRFNPSRLHPRLHGRDDIVGGTLDLAEELLAPYADLIDAIGVGNHETAALQAHSFDFVGELCRRLESHGGRPQQAGYTAYLHYPVLGRGGKAPGYTIWYTHGAGRAKTAAEALKYLLGRTPSWQADLYWCGHFHSRATCAEVGMMLGPDGRVAKRDVRCVVSGSYQDAYGPQSQASMARKGRKSNFASEGALLPHGLGCTRVVLHWGQKGAIEKVEVSQ
jgi:hypothetical protein